MPRPRTFLLACLLLAIGSLPARAQDPGVRAQDPGPRTWVVLGAGVGFAGGEGETNGGVGLAGHAGAAHQRGPFVLGLRAASSSGGTTGEAIPGGGTLRDRFDELALLAGYVIHREASGSQVVLSTGVAAVTGERVGPQPGPQGGTGNVDFDAVVGVPIQLALWSTQTASSFGLTLHANVNREETFGVVTLSYFVGPTGPREGAAR